jgi:hypothetical protein
VIVLPANLLNLKQARRNRFALARSTRAKNNELRLTARLAVLREYLFVFIQITLLWIGVRSLVYESVTTNTWDTWLTGLLFAGMQLGIAAFSVYAMRTQERILQQYRTSLKPKVLIQGGKSS